MHMRTERLEKGGGRASRAAAARARAYGLDLTERTMSEDGAGHASRHAGRCWGRPRRSTVEPADDAQT